MNQKSQCPFNWRSFVSVTNGLAFLGLVVTGIILFFIPPGRVANCNNWRFLILSKQQWHGLHIWFGILFCIAALIHIYYNWKCLVNYFKDKARCQLALRWEWGAALLLVWIMSVGTIRGMIPFSSLLNWHTVDKHRFDNRLSRSPASEQDVSKGAGREYRGGRNEILKYFMNTESSQADNHNLSMQGRGVGKMRLFLYCEQMAINLLQAQAILEKAGMTVDPDMTLWDIANTSQSHPSEIRRLLE